MLQTRGSLPELKNSADAVLGAEPGGSFQFLDICLSHGENSRVPFPMRLGEKLIVMLDRRRTQGLHDVCTGGELWCLAPHLGHKSTQILTRRELLHVFKFFAVTHLSHLDHKIFL